MNSKSESELRIYIDRDKTPLAEAIAEDIASHLSEVNKPLTGYAILTGQDCWVSDLIAAFDTVEREVPILDRLLGERFDVHSWQMSPQTFTRAQQVLEQLNAEFRSLYPIREGSVETDETEEMYVAKLHQSIIDGFRRAKDQLPELQRSSVFKVFTIPDSDLDVDLYSSQGLNSWTVHTKYRIWR